MDSRGETGSKSVRVAVNLCRLLLGAAFVFSGISKAIDPVGSQIKFSDYLYAFGLENFISHDYLLFAACLLAGLEFLLGVYMLFGSYRRGTSLLLLLFMAVMTPFTLYVALTNPVEDCGCFGSVVVLSNLQTFLKNLLLLGLAIFVFVFRGCIYPFINVMREWLLTIVTVTVIFMFMLGNIRNLPFIDLRPYSVGTELRDKLVTGSDERLSDFFILDSELNDRTLEILEPQGYQFLVVSAHLEGANWAYTDKVDDLYEYCMEHGYSILGLTASSEGEIINWKYNTGASYDFYQADEIPLLTMVRSNPGIVLLKDGVIFRKWSDASLPSETLFSAPLPELEKVVKQHLTLNQRILIMVLYFVVPYLLLFLIDRLKRRIRFLKKY